MERGVSVNHHCCDVNFKVDVPVVDERPNGGIPSGRLEADVLEEMKRQIRFSALLRDEDLVRREDAEERYAADDGSRDDWR